MKRTILFTLLVCLCAGNVFAKEDTDPLYQNIKGPVKNIVVTEGGVDGEFSCRYGSARSGLFDFDSKTVYLFDSIGRLTQKEKYYKRAMGDGILRQYTINNVCMEYPYNEKGAIKGEFCQIQLDSMGHEILKKEYRDGELFRIDSTIYNELGQKIEYYEKSVQHDDSIPVFRQDVPSLKATYEYDSLGRILVIKEDLKYGQDKTYTYKYKKNGSYTEYCEDVTGKTVTKRYVFNKKGQLIREVSQKGNFTTYFKKFDKYGNWTVMEKRYDFEVFIGTASMTSYYYRKIEYYE